MHILTYSIYVPWNWFGILLLEDRLSNFANLWNVHSQMWILKSAISCVGVTCTLYKYRTVSWMEKPLIAATSFGGWPHAYRRCIAAIIWSFQGTFRATSAFSSSSGALKVNWRACIRPSHCFFSTKTYMHFGILLVEVCSASGPGPGIHCCGQDMQSCECILDSAC